MIESTPPDVQIFRDQTIREFPIPAYASAGAAGFDLRVNADYVIEPGRTEKCGTGLFFAVPSGYELQIRMRGGTSYKGLLLVNAPGTVDSDYRGELLLLLYNRTEQPIQLQKGDRVCQGVIALAPQHKIVEVGNIDDLGKTDRGEGRLGSTGSK